MGTVRLPSAVHGLVPIALIALVASACAGTTPASGRTAIPRPAQPRWAEPIAEPLAPDDVATSRLIPAGAQADDRRTVPASANVPDQIVVTWSQGSDPFRQAHGLAIWQRFPEAPAWSVVYSFVDEAAAGVLGVRTQLGDLTGDGHDDVLSLESLGGSGACGVWRVIAAHEGVTGEVFRRRTCDTQVRIEAGTLVLTRCVYAPEDPHCCPGRYRTTTLRWNGEAWGVVGREVTQGRPAAT
jgi:hypothetical protein